MNQPNAKLRSAARTLLPLLAAAALGAALAAVLVLGFCRQAQFWQLGRIARLTAENNPEAGHILLASIRTAGGQALPAADPFLQRYGYRPDELFVGGRPVLFCAAAAAVIAAVSLAAARTAFLRRRQKSVRELAAYLGRVNRGEEGALLDAGQDEFCLLRDELYKTVTALQTARRGAEAAREGYAQNLANIAHQLKTPLAAACASLQLMGQGTAGPALANAAPAPESSQPAPPAGPGQPETAAPAAQALRQLARLDTLCSSLLALSRIDAGVLELAHAPVDAYTALTLAAETLNGLPGMQKTPIEIIQHGPAGFWGDLDWTVEALINLMKNCAEHSPGADAGSSGAHTASSGADADSSGTAAVLSGADAAPSAPSGRPLPGPARGKILCDYAENPLYLEITVQDEGAGFAREDLPHLFERFYRGQNPAGQGAGIGLALAKAIIEAQNGVLTARNRPEGGAQFSARFYKE